MFKYPEIDQVEGTFQAIYQSKQSPATELGVDPSFDPGADKHSLPVDIDDLSDPLEGAEEMEVSEPVEEDLPTEVVDNTKQEHLVIGRGIGKSKAIKPEDILDVQDKFPKPDFKNPAGKLPEVPEDDIF